MTSLEWKNAGLRLLEWQRVLLLTHDRPDGDALGALGAMRSVLHALGRRATACVYGEIPIRYEFLEKSAPFSVLPPTAPGELDRQYDGILIMDTCSWAQLEPAGAFLSATRLPKMVVDHHATRDDLSAASPETLYLIDPDASSACAMLYEWCGVMGWPMPSDAAVALFTGIATDTGWFRFSNTQERTLHAAAALIGAGLRADLMHARLMHSYSVARLRLLAAALGTLELHAGGCLAVMHLTREMFAAAGAKPSDTEDIVNEPLTSREVVASVLLTDQGEGCIRVNLRSKSPEVAGCDVDVAQVAARFGGGGHCRASGARVPGALGEVRERVVAAMGEAIQSAGTRA